MVPLPVGEAALGLEANWRFGPVSKPVADRSASFVRRDWQVHDNRYHGSIDRSKADHRAEWDAFVVGAHLGQSRHRRNILLPESVAPVTFVHRSISPRRQS
jgi:hypothetical protein